MILPDNAHDSLFSPATLRLGEVHWYVLKAANLMATRRNRESERNELGFRSYEQTDFGKEVGRDEINWWVFKKETDIDELRERTERVLEAVQSLKQASAKLKNESPESYEDLLSALRGFAEHRVDEIELLYDYVRWLEARDILAPTILYAYRVWGDTRMGDRWVEIDTETLEPPPMMVRKLTEIVLGLHTGLLYAFDRAYFDIGDEIWSSRDDPEDIAGSGDIEIPVAWVATRAAREACDECATYFTCVRDSLRNILLDIEKFVEQRELIHSDEFWRKFILKAVQTKKTETQLWDFKKTLTMWHVRGREKERARVTFAEDVASLANARGGVLVIGVTDQPREIVGVDGTPRGVENRLKVAQQVIANHVEYDRDLVSFHQVVLPGKGGERMCLVIVVAQACEVAGVHDGHGRYTYPVRRETGIDRVSKFHLATRKTHMKSDNHDFVRELNQFVLDN